MSPAAFIDANVPIYAAGKDHPLKAPCTQVLMLAADHPHAFITDAEVLQEMLHRYLALRLWPRGREVFRWFSELMQDRVEAIAAGDVEYAGELADSHPGLQARDLVHAAVMHRLGISQIVSTDTGFDRLPDVERLDPAKIASWRDSFLP